MTNTLDELIANLSHATEGKEEFAIFYFAPDSWQVQLGNPIPAVKLGESSGIWEGEGASAEEALRACIADFQSEPGRARR